MTAAGLVAATAMLPPSLARAGPPFVTDDPEPTDTGHWEIYNFVQDAHVPGDTQGEAGVDLNYGGAKDLQLTATLPLAFGSGEATGFGDVELAAKYRFLHQSPGGWVPDVAVFPRLFAPTSTVADGPRRFSLLLPVWAQKDWGPWSMFGGGGYQINPGPGNRNVWISGLVLQRSLGERLSLGAEIYHQTPATNLDRPLTGVNLGAIYKLTDHWALLLAGGPGVQNARREGQYDTYFSLEATY